MAPLYLDSLVNNQPWSEGPNEVPGAVLSTVVRCAGQDAWAAVELEGVDDVRLLAGVMERPDLVPSTFDDARQARPPSRRSARVVGGVTDAHAGQRHPAACGARRCSGAKH